MNYPFFNNDFDPQLIVRHAALANRMLHGFWRKVRVWENQDVLDLYNAGHPVSPLSEQEFPNGITDVGIHDLLDGWKDGTGTISTWYAGLIDNAGFTGVNASDTSSSHTGWTENQDFDESVRQTFSFGTAAARAITDSIAFTMNATKTIQGIFVVSVNTKGATTGILFSTALFASPPNLISGNVLSANYSLSD